MTLNFKVMEQRVYYDKVMTPVADSVGFLKAKFKITGSSWEKIDKKYVIFTYGEESYPAVLNENGMCEVPWEVIHAPGFLVSLMGGSRLTTEAVLVDVDPSGYHDILKESLPPTPSAYEDLLAKLEALSADKIPDDKLQEQIGKYMEEDYKPDTLTDKEAEDIVDENLGGENNGEG